MENVILLLITIVAYLWLRAADMKKRNDEIYRKQLEETRRLSRKNNYHP